MFTVSLRNHILFRKIVKSFCLFSAKVDTLLSQAITKPLVFSLFPKGNGYSCSSSEAGDENSVKIILKKEVLFPVNASTTPKQGSCACAQRPLLHLFKHRIASGLLQPIILCVEERVHFLWFRSLQRGLTIGHIFSRSKTMQNDPE